jgi:hypothetical protein
LNTARSGRRELCGLIVWKKFEKQLTDSEVREEIRNLENEGFEVRKILNSETIIIGTSSDGQSFSKSHLRQTNVHWKRLVETNIQLTVIASRLNHRKLEEWEK